MKHLFPNPRKSKKRMQLEDVQQAVEVVSKRFQLTEGESGGILNHLIKGGDVSMYGLMNAVTRHAQEVESYDRSTELERIGNQVLELPKKDFKLVA